jgi:ribosomal protein S18 acetylase RimI-like enzyme
MGKNQPQDFEEIYNQCKNIIKEETKAKLMGWIYRVLLKKSIDDGLFYFEQKDGVIIGFALCRLLVKSHTISIDKIGVHPLFRQCGVGTRLINRVKVLGLPIKLDVVAKNTVAVNFYLKNGFKIIGSKILGHDIDVKIMAFDPNS